MIESISLLVLIFILVILVMAAGYIFGAEHNKFTKYGMESFLELTLAAKDEGIDLIVFRCKECADELKEYNPYIYKDGTTIPLNRIKVIIVDNHAKCENSEYNFHHKPQKFAPIRLRDFPAKEEFTTFKTQKTSCIRPKLEFKAGHMEIVNRWIDGEINAKQAADELQISISSLYKYFGEYKRAAK